MNSRVHHAPEPALRWHAKRGLQCVTAGYIQQGQRKTQEWQISAVPVRRVTRTISQHKNSFAHFCKNLTLCRPVDCHFSTFRTPKASRRKTSKRSQARPDSCMHRLFGILAIGRSDTASCCTAQAASRSGMSDDGPAYLGRDVFRYKHCAQNNNQYRRYLRPC